MVSSQSLEDPKLVWTQERDTKLNPAEGKISYSRIWSHDLVRRDIGPVHDINSAISLITNDDFEQIRHEA